MWDSPAHLGNTDMMANPSIWGSGSANCFPPSTPSARPDMPWGAPQAPAAAQPWNIPPPAATTYQPPPNVAQKNPWDPPSTNSWNPSAPTHTAPQWGAAPPATPNWPTPQPPSQSSQWGTPSPSGRSWSDMVKQNVVQPPNSAPPPPQSQGRPLRAQGPASFDASCTWGKPVDQGTPWGESGGSGGGPKKQQHDEHMWDGGRSGGGGGDSWNNGGAQSNTWTQPPPPDNPELMWNGPPPKESWQQNPPQNMWDNSMAAPQQHAPAPPPIRSGSMWNEPAPVAQPTNMWQPPPAPAPAAPPARPSNVWEDPSPTAKRTTQPDRGTGIWGDPTSQGEIKRWKSSADDENPAPGGINTGGSISGAGSSVWENSPIAPAAKMQPGSGTWGEAGAGAAAGTGVTSPWGEQSKQLPSGKVAGSGTWGEATGSSSAVASSGWIATPVSTDGGAPIRGSVESDTNVSDDVFGSNPPTPLTPFVTKPGAMTAGTNGVNSISAMMQNYRPIAASASSSNPQHLQQLTQQIADQLRLAVKAGWISVDILGKPLPQNVLLMLNQLLMRVPKLDQARVELQNIQREPSLNAVQQQEMQRIQNDILSMEQEVQSLQAKIGASIAKTPSTPNDPTMLAQSKLTQWKAAPGSSPEGDRSSSSTLHTVHSVPNMQPFNESLQGLSLSSGDSSWKPSTGADWGGESNGSGLDKFPLGRGEATPNSELKESENGDELSGSISPKKNPLAEGPPEFTPGQPWLYHRKEVDEYTTPQDLVARRGPSIADPGIDPEQRLNTPSYNFGSKMAFNNKVPAPFGDVMNMNNMRYGMPPTSRPPSQMGARFQRSASASGAPSAFQPYAAGWGSSPNWLVLMNLSPQIDEAFLKSICQRMGQVQTFIHSQSGHFAVAKLKDVALDKIVPRLQQDLAQFGVTVQIAKDQEVDRLVNIVQPRHPMISPVATPAPPSAAGMMWDPHSGAGAPWPQAPFMPPPVDILGPPMPDSIIHEHAPY